MRRLLIQPQARVDLLEIWHYIATDSIPAANRVSERLDAAMHDLLTIPGKGHVRPDVRDANYRFWSVFSYIIAYRYDDQSLTIIRIIHGRRDLRRVLESD